MKLSFTYILIASFFFISSDTKDAINYSHKSINKAIKAELNYRQAQLIEHKVNDSIFFLPSGKYFYVKTKELDKTLGFTYVGRLACCKAGGCDNPSSINSSSNAPAEYLDYFILYDSTFTVKHVGIFNYQATYGYGVTAKSWLKQFNNLSSKSENINNFKVDAISGATVSVNAITQDVLFHTKNIKRAF